MKSNHDTTALGSLGRHRYMSLRTFRRDGTPIDSPMWFAIAGGAVHLRTQEGAVKRKRMSNNPQVEMRPSNAKGAVVDDLVVKGTATVLDGDDAQAGDRLLHDRYGWQYNVVPMLPMPGLPTAPVTLPWSERLRRMRATSLWESFVIVRIDPVPA